MSLERRTHTEDRQTLVGNASKLAVLGGGNGLEAVGQRNNLVKMTHYNYNQRKSDLHHADQARPTRSA